jgi:hypothetical protein
MVKEVSCLVESYEIITNLDTMEQISESEKDIVNGKIKEADSVKDL